MVAKPDPCTPTMFKADDYSSPFSNYDAETIVGINVQGEPGIRIYPNPFSSRATIIFPNPEAREYRLVLTDIPGRVIRTTTNISSNQFELNRENLPPGIYLLELRGDKVYRSKIVIE